MASAARTAVPIRLRSSLSRRCRAGNSSFSSRVACSSTASRNFVTSSRNWSVVLSSFSIADSSSLALCSSCKRASTTASPASASLRARGCTSISSAVSCTASNWRSVAKGSSRALGSVACSTWSNMSSMRLCCAFRNATTSSGDLTIMSAIADTSCVGRVGYARSGCMRLAQAYPPAESLNGGAYCVGAQPVSSLAAVLAARGALP